MTVSDATPAMTLTLGPCNDMRAEVLLRIASSGESATITGTFSGPHRGRDTTLPVTARLQPTATAGLARVILTEPAYWTPDLPNRYRLRATVTAAGQPPQEIDSLVGLRRLGGRGRSLWLDGHRWVPRAVRVEGVAGIEACKPAALAALVTEPDDAVLARADEIGVALLALIAASAGDDPAAVADRIATWSTHPSVAIANLPPELPAATVAEIARSALPRKGTLLLGATVASTAPPPTTIPPGIDALVVALKCDALPHEAWLASAPAPVIAWRRIDASPTTGRAPCDTLQATLAGWGARDGETRAWDWAGYVVG